MRTLFIVTALLSSFWLAGQNETDSKGRKQGPWVAKYESGKVRYRGNFQDDIPVGTFEYFYMREGLMSKLYYRGTTNVARAEVFHKNGKLMATGIYRNQEKDSLWTYYDREGVKTSTEFYVNGLLQGPQLVFYESGELAQRIDFEAGVENGLWIRKWEGGGMRTKGIYVNGMLHGECTYFNDEGRPEARGHYVEGLKDGTWNYFNEGKVERVEVYKRGQMESFTDYSEDGSEQ